MMKIAFVYDFLLESRPIDFDNLLSSQRGLTGSELSCIFYANELAKLGHDVTLYIPTKTETWENIKLKNVNDPKEDCDVVYSWNNPNVLRHFPTNSLRLVNVQINDLYGPPDFDNYVDIYTSPSLPHKWEMVKKYPFINENKWFVISNGCDPSIYHNKKVPGRVVYASSPDRGLHHLLNIWPQIKKAVPHATLKVFYDIFGYIEYVKNAVTPDCPVWTEWRSRCEQIQNSLVSEGVEVIGSVSRNQIADELSQAEVLAYPCDPVVWTEGFSVTTLEACAAGTIPVITSADALGFIYGNTVPMIYMPVCWQLEKYKNLVIRTLASLNWRRNRHQPLTASKVKNFAKQYQWDNLAKHLESLLTIAIERKK